MIQEIEIHRLWVPITAYKALNGAEADQGVYEIIRGTKEGPVFGVVEYPRGVFRLIETDVEKIRILFHCMRLGAKVVRVETLLGI